MASDKISTWHRLTLTPGVELHFEGTDPNARALVARILELVAGNPEPSLKREAKERS